MGDKSAGEGRPPPSPLTGGYLLIVLPQTHFHQHQDNVLHNLTKGLITWDKEDCHVDLEKELDTITAQAPEGEEAKNRERLIQFASENLVTEVLIFPQLNTLVQCMRNLLSSFTRHRHIIHAGYTCAGNGAWMLQDGTYSFADFALMYQEHEVQRVLRAYENTVTVDVHCCQEGDWNNLKAKDPFSKVSRVRLNPNDKMTATKSIHGFVNYLKQYVVSGNLEELLESSEVVGNIRFSHPTLYVFPGGQGDAALFGINGFNMLVDGGFARKSCFWDFTRHLDRLDAVLMTRINNGNILGLSSLLQRKKMEQVYPQIGHFFCNIQERKHPLSPDGDKDKDPLVINLIEYGQEMVANLRHLQLKPQSCYRESSMDPINLYHKVGHGKLDMYVLSPSKDSREVRDFMVKWNTVDSKIFCSHNRRGGEFNFPLCNRTSICALLVWQPANPEDNITRILFPGSTPQHKIFEGLDRLKNLEFMKHAVCSAKTLSPSPSSVGLNIRSASRTKAPAIIDKIPENEMKGKGVEAVKPVVKVSSTADKIQKSQPAKTSKPKQVDKPKDKIKTDVEMKPETVKNDTIKQTEAVQKLEKPKEKPKKLIQKPTAEKKPVTEKKATEKKSETIKSSPTTPKKVAENKLTETAPKTEAKPRSSTRSKPSPSATPAKSAKEANNRKVLEQKSRELSRSQKPPAKKEEQKKTEKPSVPRKTSSPSKAAKPSSPVKVSRPLSKKPEVKKAAKSDKEAPTDSAVSTPSTADAEKPKDVAEKEESPAELPAEEKDDKPSTLSSKEEEEDILIVEKVEIDIIQPVESLQVVEEDGEQAKEPEPAALETDAKLKSKDELLDVQQSAGGDTSKSKVETAKTESQETSVGIKDLPSEKLTPPKDKEGKEKSNEMVELRIQADESQPDEKFSTTVESGQTTTAPTLPEDERIPLDDVKEGVEEKHIKEDTKEKESSAVPKPEPMSLPEVPMVSSGVTFDQRAQLLKDIVKTPDEVADLPVHEEADGGFYEGSDAAAKEMSESREDLETQSAKRDKLEAGMEAEELKFIKDGFEKEDKSKDLKEDFDTSTPLEADTTKESVSKDQPEEKLEVKEVVHKTLDAPSLEVERKSSLPEGSEDEAKLDKEKQETTEVLKEEIVKEEPEEREEGEIAEAKIKGDLDIKEKDEDTKPEKEEQQMEKQEDEEVEIATATKLPKDILKYEATLLDDDGEELEEDKDKETEKEKQELTEEKIISDTKETESEKVESKEGKLNTESKLDVTKESAEIEDLQEQKIDEEKIDIDKLKPDVTEIEKVSDTKDKETKDQDVIKISSKEQEKEEEVEKDVEDSKDVADEKVEKGKSPIQKPDQPEVPPTPEDGVKEESVVEKAEDVSAEIKKTEDLTTATETVIDAKDTEVEKEDESKPEETLTDGEQSKELPKEDKIEQHEGKSVSDELEKIEEKFLDSEKKDGPEKQGDKPEQTPVKYISPDETAESQAEEKDTVCGKALEEKVYKEADVVIDEVKDLEAEMLRKASTASLLKDDDITLPDKEVFEIMQNNDGIISDIEASIIKESLPGTIIEPPKVDTWIGEPKDLISPKPASPKASPTSPKPDSKKSSLGEVTEMSDKHDESKGTSPTALSPALSVKESVSTSPTKKEPELTSVSPAVKTRSPQLSPHLNGEVDKAKIEALESKKTPSPKESPTHLKKEDDSHFDISEDSPADIYKKDSLVSLVDTKSETSREVSPIPAEHKITLDADKFDDKETLKKELESAASPPMKLEAEFKHDSAQGSRKSSVEEEIEVKKGPVIEAFPLLPRDDKNKDEPEKPDDSKEKLKEDSSKPEAGADAKSKTPTPSEPKVNGIKEEDKASGSGTPAQVSPTPLQESKESEKTEEAEASRATPRQPSPQQDSHKPPTPERLSPEIKKDKTFDTSSLPGIEKLTDVKTASPVPSQTDQKEVTPKALSPEPLVAVAKETPDKVSPVPPKLDDAKKEAVLSTSLETQPLQPVESTKDEKTSDESKESPVPLKPHDKETAVSSILPAEDEPKDKTTPAAEPAETKLSKSPSPTVLQNEKEKESTEGTATVPPKSETVSSSPEPEKKDDREKTGSKTPSPHFMEDSSSKLDGEKELSKSKTPSPPPQKLDETTDTKSISPTPGKESPVPSKPESPVLSKPSDFTSEKSESPVSAKTEESKLTSKPGSPTETDELKGKSESVSKEEVPPPSSKTEESKEASQSPTPSADELKNAKPESPAPSKPDDIDVSKSESPFSMKEAKDSLNGELKETQSPQSPVSKMEALVDSGMENGPSKDSEDSKPSTTSPTMLTETKEPALSKSPSPPPTKQETETPSPTLTKEESKTPSPLPTKDESKPSTPLPTKEDSKPSTPLPAKEESKTPSPLPTKEESKPSTPLPTKDDSKPSTPLPAKEESKTPSPLPTKEESKPSTPLPTKEESKPSSPLPAKEESKTPSPLPTKEESKPSTPLPTKEESKPSTPLPAKEESKTPSPLPIKEESKPSTPFPTKDDSKQSSPLPEKEELKTPSPPLAKEESKPPTPLPTKDDSKAPSPIPSKVDTKTPSPQPTKEESKSSTPVSTKEDSKAPSPHPTKEELKTPSPPLEKEESKPSTPLPTKDDSKVPSPLPSKEESKAPSPLPTKEELKTPSPPLAKEESKPSTPLPTKDDSKVPSPLPSKEESKAPSPLPTKEELKTPSPPLAKEESKPSTPLPTKDDSKAPSPLPSKEDSKAPSPAPTKEDSTAPSPLPTKEESKPSTPLPSKEDSTAPSPLPTKEESKPSTPLPTKEDSKAASPLPAKEELRTPSPPVTKEESKPSSPLPTKEESTPSTVLPPKEDSKAPSPLPTKEGSKPSTPLPSKEDSKSPSPLPSKEDSKAPSPLPTKEESKPSTPLPTKDDSKAPSPLPTKDDSKAPSPLPTKEESKSSSSTLTKEESKPSTPLPTKEDSKAPSPLPTKEESKPPTPQPTKEDSKRSSPALTNVESKTPSPTPSKQMDSKADLADSKIETAVESIKEVVFMDSVEPPCLKSEATAVKNLQGSIETPSMGHLEKSAGSDLSQVSSAPSDSDPVLKNNLNLKEVKEESDKSSPRQFSPSPNKDIENGYMSEENAKDSSKGSTKQVSPVPSDSPKISDAIIMSELEASLNESAQELIDEVNINEKDLERGKEEGKVTDILTTAERIVSSLDSTVESVIDKGKKYSESFEKKGEEKLNELAEKISDKKSEVEEEVKRLESNVEKAVTSEVESLKKEATEVKAAVENLVKKEIGEKKGQVEAVVKESSGFFSGLKASVVDSIGKITSEVSSALKTDTKDPKQTESAVEVSKTEKEEKVTEPGEEAKSLEDIKDVTTKFLSMETKFYGGDTVPSDASSKVEAKVVEQGAEIVEDVLKKGKAMLNEQECRAAQSSEPVLVSSAITALKKEFSRSATPSDVTSEKEDGRSTPRSDISSGQLSHAITHGWSPAEGGHDSDEDIPSSPMSVASHIPSPPQFDYDITKESMMTGSIYGALPEDDDFPPTVKPPADPMYTSMYISQFDDELTLDRDSALRTAEPTSISGTTGKPGPAGQTEPASSTSTTTKEDTKSKGEPKDPIGKWDKPLGLPPPPDLNSRQFNYWNPYKEWGQPLGLPSPAPPPREDTDVEVDTSGSAKTTPKKVAKMNAENNKFALNTAGKEVNNRTKRSESPVKRMQNKESRKSASNPIYMDLSYVPHHGNSHYANVEFFKRVRARYYVFSGTEPSKEVFNALLEAKQTWEDKDLEVTIIPTYDTDILGYWIAENEETLSKYKIDLSPSASRCTINLQDHDTSCSAYRLEF